MRLFLAILVGKLIFFLTRVFKIGGGSAAPGLYALKIEPKLVQKLVSQIPTNIIITGTNGKTTTARLLNHLVQSQNLKTIRNSTGSNLERGIASTLISQTSLTSLKLSADLGIWEVDEAAFNSLIKKIRPNIIVFLNAFRDQLDRYGEVDTVVKKWWDSLDEIDFKPIVITNFNDPKVSHLSNHRNVSGQRFVLQNHVLEHEANIEVKMKRGSYDFIADLVKNNGLSGTEIKVTYNHTPLDIKLNIPGIYHIYDFLAAFSIYYNLNLPANKVSESLEDFKPAFGRVEEIEYKNKKGFLFLIKNPAGANSVFETLAPEIKSEDRVLMALNDNFADGTDISWIWDAKLEILQNKHSTKIIVSGKRAEDLGLRLKYAGFREDHIEIVGNLEEALERAFSGLKGRLFIMPTYTAMLSLQKILAKKGVKKAYWAES